MIVQINTNYSLATLFQQSLSFAYNGNHKPLHSCRNPMQVPLKQTAVQIAELLSGDRPKCIKSTPPL